MVFSNKNAFFNYAIIPGKLTSSDNLPVIIKLSAKPIVKTGQEKYKFTEANWDLFKEKIEMKIETENRNNDLTQRNNIDALITENNLIKWLSIITETRDEIIPKAKLTCYIHAGESDYLKLLEDIYKNIINILYWARLDLEILKETQRRLMEENLRLYKEAWETKIEYLNETYKDSAKFWGKVKQLIGSNKEKVEYLIDTNNNNNNRVYKDEDKEILYRNIWEKIFEIPPEDNCNSNVNNENLVREYLECNSKLSKHYQFADLSRLDEDNILIKPVRASGIILYIKYHKRF